MFGIKTKPMPESWTPSHEHHGRHSEESRPKPLQRADTLHSRYVEMLLEQDYIPKAHSILASIFVWLLLAGFLVFPGTFTTISKTIEEKESEGWTDKTAEKIFKSVKNIPLLVIGAIICAISAIGMASLAIKHMKNYVWLINKLFFPGMANCLAGLISTLVGVYSQQHGIWSATARVTAIAEGASLAVCAGLYIFIDQHLLTKVKQSHGKHYDGWSQNANSEIELACKV